MTNDNPVEDRKGTLEKLSKELEGLIARQLEIDTKIKESGEITSKFPLTVARPDAKRLDESLATIKAQIENIKYVQKQFEVFDIKKTQECCPDVCASIKRMKTAAEDERANLGLYREDMIKTLERLGIKTYKAARTARQEDFIKERISELSELERILEINNICKCA